MFFRFIGDIVNAAEKTQMRFFSRQAGACRRTERAYASCEVDTFGRLCGPQGRTVLLREKNLFNSFELYRL